MSDDQQRALRRDRLAVTVSFFAYGVIAGVWAARIPSVQAARGLSVGVLGAALLTPAAGSVAALPVAGGLVARHGSRTVLLGSAACFCAVSPLLAWAPGLGGFVAALAVFGASAAVLDVVVNVRGVQVEHRYGRSVLTGMHAAWSLGAFAGTGVGAAAAAGGLSPGWTLLAAAVAVLAVLTVCARRYGAERAADTGPAFALPDRATVVVGLVVFASTFVEAAAGDWSAVYLHRSVGASLPVAATGFAAFSVAMVAGRLGGDALVDRFGPVRTARWPAAVGAVALAAGLATGRLGPALAGFALAGLGTAVLFPLGVAAAGRRTDDPARAVAGAVTVGYLGWLTAPGVIGSVSGATSLSAGLGLAAFVLAAGAVLARSLRRAP